MLQSNVLKYVTQTDNHAQIFGTADLIEISIPRHPQAFIEAFQAAPSSKTIAFLYVMNDVAQKRRQFIKSFEMKMQAILKIALRKDKRIKQKILRLIGIWRDRSIFRREVLSAAKSLVQHGGRNPATSSSRRKPMAQVTG